MATYAFNMVLDNIAVDSFAEAGNQRNKTTDIIMRKRNKGAFFDARAFSLPRNEVVNCFIWRQQDATRNSIQALAQSLYSHNELQGINCNSLQDKMFTEKGVNWNDLTTYQKRGACAVKRMMKKKVTLKDGSSTIIERPEWIIDFNIPIFTQDRDYINSLLTFDED